MWFKEFIESLGKCTGRPKSIWLQPSRKAGSFCRVRHQPGKTNPNSCATLHIFNVLTRWIYHKYKIWRPNWKVVLLKNRARSFAHIISCGRWVRTFHMGMPTLGSSKSTSSFTMQTWCNTSLRSLPSLVLWLIYQFYQFAKILPEGFWWNVDAYHIDLGRFELLNISYKKFTSGLYVCRMVESMHFILLHQCTWMLFMRQMQHGI